MEMSYLMKLLSLAASEVFILISWNGDFTCTPVLINFSLLAAMEVVILATSSATRVDFVYMTTFQYQSIDNFWSSQ